MDWTAFLRWLHARTNNTCADNVQQKASAYLAIAFVVVIALHKCLRCSVVPFCTAVIPLVFTVSVFALVCSVKSMQAQKCPWYLASLSIAAHNALLVFCACNVSVVRPVHYLISLLALACVFLTYTLLHIWPYNHAPRIAVLVALIAMLLHASIVA